MPKDQGKRPKNQSNYDKKWKRFEQLVADIQSQLSPQAQVLTNQRIKGKNSGTTRQIDIIIKQRIGQFELSIVIDCKDHSRPINVKTVESFIGLVKDVLANQGALVAPNGFTSAAKRVAENSGIQLYRPVDTRDHDWHTIAAIPLVCAFTSLESIQYLFISENPDAHQEIRKHNPQQLPLYDQRNNPIGSPMSLAIKKWTRRQVPITPGIHRIDSLSDEPLYIREGRGDLIPIRLAANVLISQQLYFANVPLAKAIGLLDETTGYLFFPPSSEIITDWINLTEIKNTWLRIPSLEKLAIKPMITFHAYPHSLEES